MHSGCTQKQVSLHDTLSPAYGEENLSCRSSIIVKDNLFPVPPLFRLIQEQSGTPWEEMYKVFNMGHRMEVYVDEELAEEIIAISKSFNIDAQIVGRCYDNDEGEGNKLTILSEFGKFIY